MSQNSVALQVKLNRKPFLDRLKLISPLISNGLLPVLGYIHLQVSEDRITLSANDLERSVVVEVEPDTYQVDQPGQVLIPFAPLHGVFSKWASETITLKVVKGVASEGELLPPTDDEHTVYLCGEGSDADIRCEIPLSDFPTPPQPGRSNKTVVSLPAQDFKRLLEDVAICAATDESRPILTGVLVEVQGTTMTAVAADGFRLSQGTAIIPKVKQAQQWIIPANSGLLVGRLTGAGVEDVSLSIDDKQQRLFVEGQGFQLSTSLIQGQYPDYGQIIPPPGDGDCVTTLAMAEFRQATRSIEPYVSDIKAVTMEHGQLVRMYATKAEGWLQRDRDRDSGVD